jgi:protein translocase SecG subunit
MSLLVILLSIVLVLNAAFLVLLILIQLPKKEAGAGLAFGAGATDALFGAGSGNALTKMTKYAATMFLGLVLALSILNHRVAHQGSRQLELELKKRASAPAPLPAAGTNAAASQVTGAAKQAITITPVTNANIKITPVPGSTTTTPAAPAAPVPPAPQPATPAK